jgi:hypothetical protein
LEAKLLLALDVKLATVGGLVGGNADLEEKRLGIAEKTFDGNLAGYAQTARGAV